MLIVTDEETHAAWSKIQPTWRDLLAFRGRRVPERAVLRTRLDTLSERSV